MSNQPQNAGLARRNEMMQGLAALIERKKGTFASVGGKYFDPDRLVKLAQGALARTPKLAECTPASVLVALMRCAELGLEPDAALPQKRMWLIPRKNKKMGGAMECTFLLDYRAQINKSRESGLVKSIIAECVYERDEFHVHYDAEGSSITKFTFKPKIFEERGKLLGYFAAARIEGGEIQFYGSSVQKMQKFVADRQLAQYGGPWTTDFDQQALKTCLRRLFNLLPAGESEQARLLQARMQEEAEREEAGKPVQAVDLDMGVEDVETAASPLVLPGDTLPAQDEPPQDAPSGARPATETREVAPDGQGAGTEPVIVPDGSAASEEARKPYKALEGLIRAAVSVAAITHACVEVGTEYMDGRIALDDLMILIPMMLARASGPKAGAKAFDAIQTMYSDIADGLPAAEAKTIADAIAAARGAR